MPPVAYFEHPMMPGVQHFQCSATRCTLSVNSCAAQYRRMKGSGSACAGCAIGAEHAGEAVRVMPNRICCRCGRTDQRIIRQQICVSCFNREREWLVGKNGKGQFPKLARPVFAAEVLVDGNRVRIERVASVVESVIVAFQRHPEAAVIPLGRV